MEQIFQYLDCRDYFDCINYFNRARHNKPLRFRILLKVVHLLYAVLSPTFSNLPVSPRRLLHLLITFTPSELTTIIRHLAHILPPLSVFTVSLAVYAPNTLIAILDATTAPLMLTALGFYLAFFLRRGQTWAPRIFSSVPWAALRLAAVAIITANLTLILPPTIPVFLVSVIAITIAIVLMHYTTFTLAADIIAPRRIRTI